MSLQYTHQVLKVVVAQICQTIGWHSIQSTTLELLVDILDKYLKELARETHRYSELCERTEPNLSDVEQVFRDMNINLVDLEEYIRYVDPVNCAIDVPKYPIHKESNLNFLKPGSREIISRQVHIHEHLPAIYPEKENENNNNDTKSTINLNNISIKDDNNENINDTNNQQNSHSNNNNDNLIVNNNTNNNTNNNNNANNNNIIINNNDGEFKKPNDNIFELLNNKRRKFGSVEEKGRPTREITSVVMTTSGFISPAREGKLPDSKTPIIPSFAYEQKPCLSPSNPLSNVSSTITNNQVNSNNNNLKTEKSDKITDVTTPLSSNNSNTTSYNISNNNNNNIATSSVSTKLLKTKNFDKKPPKKLHEKKLKLTNFLFNPDKQKKITTSLTEKQLTKLSKKDNKRLANEQIGGTNKKSKHNYVNLNLMPLTPLLSTNNTITSSETKSSQPNISSTSTITTNLNTTNPTNNINIINSKEEIHKSKLDLIDGKLIAEPDKQKLNIFKKISSTKLLKEDLLTKQQQHDINNDDSGKTISSKHNIKNDNTEPIIVIDDELSQTNYDNNHIVPKLIKPPKISKIHSVKTNDNNNIDVPLLSPQDKLISKKQKNYVPSTSTSASSSLHTSTKDSPIKERKKRPNKKQKKIDELMKKNYDAQDMEKYNAKIKMNAYNNMLQMHSVAQQNPPMINHPPNSLMFPYFSFPTGPGLIPNAALNPNVYSTYPNQFTPDLNFLQLPRFPPRRHDDYEDETPIQINKPQCNVAPLVPDSLKLELPFSSSKLNDNSVKDPHLHSLTTGPNVKKLPPHHTTAAASSTITSDALLKLNQETDDHSDDNSKLLQKAHGKGTSKKHDKEHKKEKKDKEKGKEKIKEKDKDNSLSTLVPPITPNLVINKIKKKKDKKDKKKNMKKDKEEKRERDIIKDKLYKKVKKEKKKDKDHKIKLQNPSTSKTINDNMFDNCAPNTMPSTSNIEKSVSISDDENLQVSTVSSAQIPITSISIPDVSTTSTIASASAAITGPSTSSIPKLTLKLGPAMSPRPDTPESHRKVTIIKPLKGKSMNNLNEQMNKISSTQQMGQRESSPELAKISALVTRPPKPPKQTQKKKDHSHDEKQKDSLTTPTTSTGPTRGRPRNSTNAAIAQNAAAASNAATATVTSANPSITSSSALQSSTISQELIGSKTNINNETNFTDKKNKNFPIQKINKIKHQKQHSETNLSTNNINNSNIASINTNNSSNNNNNNSSNNNNISNSNNNANLPSSIISNPTNVLSAIADNDGNQVWICPACGRVDDGTPMIGCDGCDAWYHWVCVGIQVPPDATEDWYCRVCIVKKQEESQSSLNEKKKKRKKKDKKEHLNKN